MRKTESQFLSTHSRALMVLMREPNSRIRDVAAAVGITERAAQRVVSQLVGEGYLTRTRVGKRCHYVVHRDRVVEPIPGLGFEIGEILAPLVARAEGDGSPRP